MKYRFIMLIGISIIFCAAVKPVMAVNDQITQNLTMQTNEVAMINASGNPTSLDVTSSGVPGVAPQGDSDNTTYLAYTSTVASGLKRKITAAWGISDQAPAGTHIQLQLTSIPSNCGTAQAAVTLSSTPQDLATNVGSCYTDSGGNGATVQYNFIVDNVTLLRADDDKTITVTFLLADAS